MSSKEIEEQVIESYKKDENMMVLVFAQWCINHELDPVELYLRAYPNQEKNQALSEAMALTVSKEEAGEINVDTVINVLTLFGNEDLAIIVTEASDELAKG